MGPSQRPLADRQRWVTFAAVIGRDRRVDRQRDDRHGAPTRPARPREKRPALEGTGWGALRPDDGARTCAILPSKTVRIARGAFGDVTARNPALVFLTSNEAADLLRLSRRTLERWRLEGNGPRYIKLGVGKRSRVVYREAEIEAWVSRSSFGSTSEYTKA